MVILLDRGDVVPLTRTYSEGYLVGVPKECVVWQSTAEPERLKEETKVSPTDGPLPKSPTAANKATADNL